MTDNKFYLPLTAIKPYYNNPRKNERAIAKVAESIATNGFLQPIVLDKNHVIIVGHTRYAALKQLERTEAWVEVADKLTKAQVKAYRLADNRCAEEAEWDIPKLTIELKELRQEDPTINLPRVTCFDLQEINNTLALANNLEIEDSSHVPSSFLEPPVSEIGDVWELGKHRLMCGDATKWQDMSRLMEEEKADLIFTDPPYNVEYTGSMGGKRDMMANDGLSDGEFFYFLKSAFDNYARLAQLHASAYICHASSMQTIFQEALEKSGFAVRNQIIWAKSHFSLTNSRYKPQHEPIFYCRLQGETDRWYGKGGESTLWHIKKNMVNPLHPTMKPLELVLRAIHNSSLVGEIVLDCFGGSGSTLIACETAERKARLMELAPRYVDTIIRRWESQTGKEARLVASGATFSAIRQVKNSDYLQQLSNLCLPNQN